MGMFDYVEYLLVCPSCGTMIRDFQTKSLYKMMTKVEIKDIPEFGTFYSSCHKCGLWVEFRK